MFAVGLSGVFVLAVSAVLLAMPGTTLLSLLQAGSFGGKRRVPVEIQIPIQAGESSRALRFYRDPLAGFEDQNAASVHISVTTRHQLGRSIGDALIVPGASGGLRSHSTTLASVLLGRDSIVFPITWADGSRSVFRMYSSNVHEPEYIRDSGRDADGNRLPEFGPWTGEQLDRHVGLYRFSSERNLSDWLQVARFNALTVAGEPTMSFVCERVLDRLVCRYT